MTTPRRTPVWAMRSIATVALSRQHPLKARCSRGAVLVEYVFVVSLALAITLGLFSAAPRMVQNYSLQRAILYDSDP